MLLVGIVAIWVIGIVLEICGVYVPNVESGYTLLIPNFSSGLAVPSLAPIAFHLDFSSAAPVAFVMFVLALFLSPLFLAIPSFATAPALILVGFLMMTCVTSIDFSDLTEAVPAFICLIAMPFFYSITEGIALGIISYVLINAFTGGLKKINWFMWVLAAVFVLKYILI